MVADFRVEITKALEQGTTLQDFAKRFPEIVAKHGWTHTGTPGWRSRIIYETNLSMAYSAGRWAQATEPETLAQYPYWQYVHSGSLHPRLNHLSWNGLTLRADDPWWSTHWPPNGWRCGCRVRPLSARGLARQGKSAPDQAPPIETYQWTNPKTGEVHQVPKGIDPSFDYNPGQAWKAEPVSIPANATFEVPPLKPAVAAPALPLLSGYAETWRRAFEAVDETAIRAITRAPPLERLPDEPGKPPYYRRRDPAGIHMPGMDPATSDGRVTWRHEFGHHLDATHPGAPRSRSGYASEQLVAVMEQTRADLVADVTRSQSTAGALADRLRAIPPGRRLDDTIDRVLSAVGSPFDRADIAVMADDAVAPALTAALAARDVRSTLKLLHHLAGKPDSRAAAVMLSDLVDAVTRHAIGGHADGLPGHTAEYYTLFPPLPGDYTAGHAVETFANSFALRTGAPVYRRVMEWLLPDLGRAMERLLETY
nr:phage minor head protein [Rhodoplanes serenus]